jgi:hypothetical protein
MRAIWSVPLAIMGTLVLIAGVVFGLDDANILVPPPEVVVEGFMRSLASERYEPAREYLSDNLQRQTTPETLRHLTRQLTGRTGRIADVRGEPGWMGKDQAEATALLKTERAGTVQLIFQLIRRQGVWSITRLPSVPSVVTGL